MSKFTRKIYHINNLNILFVPLSVTNLNIAENDRTEFLIVSNNILIYQTGIKCLFFYI